MTTQQQSEVKIISTWEDCSTSVIINFFMYKHLKTLFNMGFRFIIADMYEWLLENNAYPDNDNFLAGVYIVNSKFAATTIYDNKCRLYKDNLFEEIKEIFDGDISPIAVVDLKALCEYESKFTSMQESKPKNNILKLVKSNNLEDKINV